MKNKLTLTSLFTLFLFQILPLFVEQANAMNRYSFMSFSASSYDEYLDMVESAAAQGQAYFTSRPTALVDTAKLQKRRQRMLARGQRRNLPMVDNKGKRATKKEVEESASVKASQVDEASAERAKRKLENQNRKNAAARKALGSGQRTRRRGGIRLGFQQGDEFRATLAEHRRGALERRIQKEYRLAGEQRERWAALGKL